MKKFLLSLALVIATFSHSFGAGMYTSTVVINNDIELTVEVIDVAKNCQTWGYHYGEIINLKSRSLTNSPYNITFNLNIFSGLGSGNASYGGSYNLSSTNMQLDNVVVFNNGKQVNYPNKYRCEDLTLADINLIRFSMDYWGSVNGAIGGNFNAGVLPIELISFDATSNQNQVDLSWATASEKNNDFFTIERTVDGINFEEIGKVAGQGNSSTKNSYEFTDFRPRSGVSYYRLKQTDFNGDSETFEVKSVNIQKGELVSSVYPNPAILNRTTVFIEHTNSIVTLNVRNLLGQLVFTKDIDASANDISEEIELTESGKMFFVDIIQNETIIARHKLMNN